MQSDEDVKAAAIGLITSALWAHKEENPDKRLSRFAEGMELFIDSGSVYDLYAVCSLVVDISAYLVELSATSLNVEPDFIMSQLADEVRTCGIATIYGNEADLGLDGTN